MTKATTLQFPISSPGVNHVIAVELLRESDKLPPGVRKALAEATGGNGSELTKPSRVLRREPYARSKR